MPRIDAKKPGARRRTSPLVECLEGRQMLNATPISHPQIAPVQFNFSPEVAHATVTHATSGHAKTAHAAVAHKVKAFKVHSKLLNLDVIPGTPTPVGKPSGSATPVAPVQATFAPVPGAYNPTQLETAYGVNLLGLANQGQGVTIGIVDELDDTAILNDASKYSAQYGLPQFDGLNGNPTLTVIKDTALGNVGSAVGTTVALETSLDVEMAHAMAPKANILLVEVPASGGIANQFAQLLHGVQLAASKPNVVTVSLSYGYPETSIGSSATLIAQNNTYLASGAAASVAVTVSTGDYSTPLYPAVSPNVIGVGGTALYLASARGRYANERAWGGLDQDGSGGGGPSVYFSAPTFQTSNGVNFGNRAIPDISMNADSITGVSVYDSLDANQFNGGSPWFSVGGTSEAAPLFAGVLALAQQQRINAPTPLPLLTSVQVNNLVYGLYNSPAYSTYFHDITAGTNQNIDSSGRRPNVTGYSATTGYDLATGIGSPIANTLVPYLATH